MKRRRTIDWRRALTGFGVRFLASFLILGAAYLLIFGWPGHRKRPLTPAGKIAAVRSTLDETYVAGANLANFDESSVVAMYDLGQVYSQFQAADQQLKTALKAAPPQVSPALRASIQKVIDQQAGAMSAYQSRLEVIGIVAQYDPATDLMSASASKSISVTGQRAQAAQNGLKKALTDASGPGSGGQNGLGVTTAGAQLLDTRTSLALSQEVNCFAKLAARAAANDVRGAAAVRASCIAGYPALRLGIIQNIVQPAFGGSYQQTMKQSVPPLLKQLDSLNLH